MSATKIQKLKKILTASGGCNCRTKATDVIEPKPKSSNSDHRPTNCSSGSSSDRPHGGEDCATATFSLTSPHFCHVDQAKLSTTVAACRKIQDSFAIVKNSENPYQDFRQSMLQMIFEKEIYSRNDLQQLLDCFLQLNSQHHHGVIVQAFTEIWNGGIAGGDAAVSLH